MDPQPFARLCLWRRAREFRCGKVLAATTGTAASVVLRPLSGVHVTRRPAGGVFAGPALAAAERPGAGRTDPPLAVSALTEPPLAVSGLTELPLAVLGLVLVPPVSCSARVRSAA